MFDANIQYYCYDNVEGDEYGVGYLGNKEFWVHLVNSWKRNDSDTERFTVEGWDELDSRSDFYGCELAEVVPDDQNFNVYWIEKDQENSMIITHDSKIVWENNPKNRTTVPGWVRQLKKQLKDTRN